jgi:hypothetical protein
MLKVSPVKKKKKTEAEPENKAVTKKKATDSAAGIFGNTLAVPGKPKKPSSSSKLGVSSPSIKSSVSGAKTLRRRDAESPSIKVSGFKGEKERKASIS